jgi:hypothetical protein
MKQGERKAIALQHNDAAVLFECSNDPKVLIPRLTIHNGQFAEDGEDGNVFPPSSAVVFGQSVRELYEMLHEYYTNSPIDVTSPTVGKKIDRSRINEKL